MAFAASTRPHAGLLSDVVRFLVLSALELAVSACGGGSH
jgi:hypothetical protein